MAQLLAHARRGGTSSEATRIARDGPPVDPPCCRRPVPSCSCIARRVRTAETTRVHARLDADRRHDATSQAAAVAVLLSGWLGCQDGPVGPHARDRRYWLRPGRHRLSRLNQSWTDAVDLHARAHEPPRQPPHARPDQSGHTRRSGRCRARVESGSQGRAGRRAWDGCGCSRHGRSAGRPQVLLERPQPRARGLDPRLLPRCVTRIAAS